MTREDKNQNIRVRFAPSPTGFMHLGNVRTALFNYLFAKKYGGQFVLRIEDTDTERSKKEYRDDILEELKWLGINWDEGPEKDGVFGPYQQSERTDTYIDYAKKLLSSGNAYYCFCGSEELEAYKNYLVSQGLPPKYSGKCASINKDVARERAAKGEAHIIRIRVLAKRIIFNDLIKGRIEFDSGLMGDIPIAKDINSPLYNFAVVIDDETMQISHVIRGEDHISNTPKQIIIQEALGFSAPAYAHLPIILGPDKTKLSKRHGSVSAVDYRKYGYLPQAMINFIAMLGWNPGSDRELFSLAELEKEFDIKKVNTAGAVFNIQKLDWFNSQYIKQMVGDELARLCLPYLKEAGLVGDEVNMKRLEKIMALEKDRLKKLSDITESADFFFALPDYQPELLVWAKSDKPRILESLKATRKGLEELSADQFDLSNIKNVVSGVCAMFSNGEVYWPIRVALSGKAASLGPLEIADVLGKEETIKRVAQAIEKLET